MRLPSASFHEQQQQHDRHHGRSLPLLRPPSGNKEHGIPQAHDSGQRKHLPLPDSYAKSRCSPEIPAHLPTETLLVSKQFKHEYFQEVCRHRVKLEIHWKTPWKPLSPNPNPSSLMECLSHVREMHMVALTRKRKHLRKHTPPEFGQTIKTTTNAVRQSSTLNISRTSGP